MDTRRPRPRAHTHTPAHAGHTPRTLREPLHPGGSRTLDSGSGAATGRGMGSLPPAHSGQQVRALHLPWCATARLLGALRSSSSRCRCRCRRRPSGLGCLRRGWRADPRTPRRRPPRRLRAPAQRPAPGMRAGRLAVSEAGRGRCRRGLGGRREGGAPLAPRSSPRFPGSWVPRPSRPGSHFTDRETEGRSDCPFAACIEGGARCSSGFTQSSPANTLYLYYRGGNWDSERESQLSKDTQRLERDPGRRDLRNPPARKFPASALAALPAVSPSTAPRPCPFVSPPPTLPRVEATRVGSEGGAFDSLATGLPSQSARPLSGLCKLGSLPSGYP